MIICILIFHTENVHSFEYITKTVKFNKIFLLNLYYYFVKLIHNLIKFNNMIFEINCFKADCWLLAPNLSLLLTPNHKCIPYISN